VRREAIFEACIGEYGGAGGSSVDGVDLEGTF
jgi:hypothetical protein